MATNLKPLPHWLSLDERKSERWPMDMAALLQTRIHPATIGVRVADISTLGCLLTMPGGMALGRCVTLTLPRSVVVEGWIAWSKTDHAGLDFARPLPVAVVEQMIREHGVASEPGR